MVRLCALLCRNHLTLLEWLSSTGSRASTMLLSCLMCVIVPDEATIAAAVCSSMASAWVAMPGDVDGGGVYELLVHANILAGLAWSLFTGRPACEGWAACSPGVRCLFALVFSFAALARLNRDFHDVRRSSSSVLALRALDTFCARLGRPGRVVTWFGDRVLLLWLRFVLLSVELAGLAVPICLWRGHTALALALAWACSLALASTSAFDFACLLAATMPFWVPPQRILALRWMTLTSTARLGTLAVAMCLLGPALLQRNGTQHRARMAALAWLLAASPMPYAAEPLGAEPLVLPSTAAGICASELAQQALAASRGGFVQQVALLTVILATLNGVSPYIGLKTQATWSLFSNLHVEGGESNHWLIPVWFQIFGYTKEVVTVTKSNVPLLQEQHTVEGGVSRLRLLRGFAERTGLQASIHSDAALCGELRQDEGEIVLPYSIPIFEFRRIVSMQAMPLLQEFYVEYLHYGAPHRFEVQHGAPTRGSDERLAVPPATLLRTLLAFRSLPADGPRGACSH